VIIKVKAMHTRHHDSKNDRIDARVRSEDKILFKKAAELSGMNLTDFTIQALMAAAVKVIKEHKLIELTLRDQKLFAESLINKVEPNKRLIEAAKRYRGNSCNCRCIK
jgi:uncharacterized protein (DUF1778 family)